MNFIFFDFAFSFFNKKYSFFLLNHGCRTIPNLLVWLNISCSESQVLYTWYDVETNTWLFVKKNVDWWHQQFGFMTHAYFTDHKPFLLMSAKIENWLYLSNLFFKGTYWVSSWYPLWISRSAFVFIFPINFGL